LNNINPNPITPISGTNVNDSSLTGMRRNRSYTTDRSAENLVILSENPMLEFSFNLIQKDSPYYKEVNQSIDLHFNQLYLMCNRETVVAFLEFLTTLSKDLG